VEQGLVPELELVLELVLGTQPNLWLTTVPTESIKFSFSLRASFL